MTVSAPCFRYRDLLPLGKDETPHRLLTSAEVGMEAVWRIEVEDLPVSIDVDDEGNDFFADVTTPLGTTIPTRAQVEAAR
ncbi:MULTISPECIES: fumarate hydratase C-terminal domain-containing protein [unclassified Ornithinimicrobium]|uniref:fumarate hydratase C-terminal domain-containing protein n=1 Tax=unclassified Ornithinimicrobium TaxID=2615080 RepID=UPI0038550655